VILSAGRRANALAHLLAAGDAEGLANSSNNRAQTSRNDGRRKRSLLRVSDQARNTSSNRVLRTSRKGGWISEQVLNWSGVPTTHLRPTVFAEWALYWTGQIKTGILRLPFGTGRHAPIATEDQARVIAKILLNPDGHTGAVYPLDGRKNTLLPRLRPRSEKWWGSQLLMNKKETQMGTKQIRVGELNFSVVDESSGAPASRINPWR
jgi:uncharacterized protein YbjT (DUF2867 family)